MTVRSRIISENGISFKIVGLIAAVVSILAVFAGAVMYISANLADSTVKIKRMQEDHVRYEALIEKNAELLNQHAKLIVILTEHSKQIDVLTQFANRGDRFTAEDGRQLERELEEVKKQMNTYEVMRNELSWIKSSLQRLDQTISIKLDKLGDKFDTHDGSKILETPIWKRYKEKQNE